MTIAAADITCPELASGYPLASPLCKRKAQATPTQSAGYANAKRLPCLTAGLRQQQKEAR